MARVISLFLARAAAMSLAAAHSHVHQAAVELAAVEVIAGSFIDR
jgi:hypothetical protein